VAVQEALAEVQKVVDTYLAGIKATVGCTSVQRVVCGTCLDYKLIVAIDADAFAAFEQSGFGPEKELLDKLKAIHGVSTVETQTYTLMAL